MSRTITLEWPTTGFTKWTGSIGRDEQLIFQTTPPTSFPAGSVGGGSWNLAEDGSGPPCPRQGAVSLKAGDMTEGIDGLGVFDGDIAVYVPFRTSTPGGKHSQPMIQVFPGVPLFFNFENVPDEQPAGVEQFGIIVELDWH